jgi:hypothetical protein
LITAEALQSRTITGRLINEQKAPVEYANVILLNSADSSFVSGTFTSPEGIFRLEDFSSDEKMLKISCLGYSTRFIAIETHPSLFDSGEIVLPFDANLLNEVVVSTRVSPFSIKNNNLIAQVATSGLSSVGTAMDVIRHLPGGSVRNDKITVFGKGEPVIYINSRKQYDLSELKQLQSSDIDRIELIMNPNAKYDAEGRSVLVIHTKRNEKNGLAVHLTEQLMQGNHFGDEELARLSYNRDKFSLFTTVGHLSSAADRHLIATFTIRDDALWKQILNESQTYSQGGIQASIGAEWAITPGQIAGGQYQGIFSDNPMTACGMEDVWRNETVFDKISMATDLHDQARKHLFNAFYRGNYTDKTALQVDIDYLKRDSKINQQINEQSPLENRDVNVHSQSNFNLFAGKLAMEYQFGENSNMESGGEYTQIEGSGFLTNPEQYITDNIYSNSEKKTGVFVNYSQLFGKLNLQIGTRYEFVSIKSTEDSTKQVKTRSTYQGFYPNLSLSGAVGKTQMGLTFAHKVKRPSFAQLNDNYYSNRFLIQKGNPYLKSENIYQLDYLLSYKTFNFILGYVYKKDPIAFSMESMNSQQHQTVMTSVNYPEYREINLQLATHFNYKILQSQLSAGIKQPSSPIDYPEEKQTRNLLSLSFSCLNDITFPGEYIFSLNFDYQGKSNYCAEESGEYKSLDLGLRKSFWNKTLALNLQVYDIFGWSEADNMTLKINNITYIQQAKSETRYLLFTINYRFNNYEKKYRGKNVAPEDMERLAFRK